MPKKAEKAEETVEETEAQPSSKTYTEEEMQAILDRATGAEQALAQERAEGAVGLLAERYGLDDKKKAWVAALPEDQREEAAKHLGGKQAEEESAVDKALKQTAVQKAERKDDRVLTASLKSGATLVEKSAEDRMRAYADGEDNDHKGALELFRERYPGIRL